MWEFSGSSLSQAKPLHEKKSFTECRNGPQTNSIFFSEYKFPQNSNFNNNLLNISETIEWSKFG